MQMRVYAYAASAAGRLTIAAIGTLGLRSGRTGCAVAWQG
jgi:hypothetical protein